MAAFVNDQTRFEDQRDLIADGQKITDEGNGSQTEIDNRDNEDNASKNPDGVRSHRPSALRDRRGGFGLGSFGPKSLLASSWGRLVRDGVRCRSSSWTPDFRYSGLVSDASNPTRSSISRSVSASGWMSSSSQGFCKPSPLL